MDLSRIVEIKADRREGTGYLIAPSLVLTAWHVVGPEGGRAADVASIRIRILGEQDLSNPTEAVTRAATVLWPPEDLGKRLDFALLRVGAVEGAAPAMTLARAPPVLYVDVPLQGQIEIQAAGFPTGNIASFDRPGGGTSLRRDTWEIEGSFSAGTGLLARSQGGRLEIGIKPKLRPGESKEAWKGISGAALFNGSRLIGIITDVSEARGAQKLLALPAQMLFGHADVAAAAVEAGLDLPPKVDFTAAPAAAPPSVALGDRVYLIDRGDLVSAVIDAIETVPDGAPSFLAVRGGSDDELLFFFRRIEHEVAEYFQETSTVLVKSIHLPKNLSDIEAARRSVRNEVKRALVVTGNPKFDLKAEDIAHHLPAGDVPLLLLTKIPAELSEMQRALLGEWTGLWSGVAATGRRIVAMIGVEEDQPIDECCRDAARPCKGASRLRQAVLPNGIGKPWRPLGSLPPITDQDMREWGERLRRLPDWRGPAPAIADPTHFRDGRGLRCVYHGLHQLIGPRP